jgi:ferric-dicitrate binding protein FerR (iron transport regulator)
VNRRDRRLAIRFVSGEATPEESEQVRRLAEESPEHAHELTALQKLSDAVSALPAQDVDVSAVWQRVSARTAQSPTTAPAPATAGRAMRSAAPMRPALWQRPLLRIAAVLALVLTSGLLWRPLNGVVRDHVVNRTVSTGKGERVELKLADGTRVLLGVESRLRHPRRFGGDTRDVHLEGAGYFEVAHDATRPFTVYTAGSVTRVLGTRFTVRDYGTEDEPARVAVTEGRVEVRARHAPADNSAATAILTPGEAAELTVSGTVALIGSRVEAADLAWTRGTIALRNASVAAVLAEIGRWYDVEIGVEDPSLAARHLTISFDDEPLDAILEEVATALDARIEKRGSTFLLTPASTTRATTPNTNTAR